MAALDAAQAKVLEDIVKKLQEDPTLVYDPSLVFFKDFLLSWGAKVPSAAPKAEAKPAAEEKKEEPKVEPEVEEEEEEEEEEEPEEPEEPDPEQLPEDAGPFPDKSPANDLELSDAQLDKQGDFKQAGAEALEDGDLAKAVEKYTEAIKIGNATAMMYAKRAEMLLKLKRPCASIADCDAAIEINPDSAKAFRMRGKAYRKIGKWVEAHKDLSVAQQLDFDDDTAEVQKFVDVRYKKIEEKNTRQRIKTEAKEKKRKEKERAKEIARRKAAKEEAERRYAEDMPSPSGGMPAGFPGGFPGGGMGGPGGMPGGMGGPGGMPGMPAGIDPSMFSHLLSDPELMQAFSDPAMMEKMKDIMSNPGNISKYQDDPAIMKLMSKVGGAFGGGGMPGGGMPEGGGMPGGGYGGAGGSAPAPNAGPTFEEVDEVD